MKSKKSLACFPALLLLLVHTTNCRADLVTHTEIDGFQTSTGPTLGQSFTTPTGPDGTTGFTGLTFNFYDSSSADLVPEASGTLYLLESEYLGITSANLLASAPGFVASTSTIQSDGPGTEWAFEASVTLQPLTMYWVYQASPSAGERKRFTQGGTPYAGGQLYGVPFDSFAPAPPFDALFQLGGTAVPEPSGFLLLGLTVTFGAGLRWGRCRSHLPRLSAPQAGL